MYYPISRNKFLRLGGFAQISGVSLEVAVFLEARVFTPPNAYSDHQIGWRGSRWSAPTEKAFGQVWLRFRQRVAWDHEIESPSQWLQYSTRAKTMFFGTTSTVLVGEAVLLSLHNPLIGQDLVDRLQTIYETFLLRRPAKQSVKRIIVCPTKPFISAVRNYKANYGANFCMGSRVWCCGFVRWRMCICACIVFWYVSVMFVILGIDGLRVENFACFF